MKQSIDSLLRDWEVAGPEGGWDESAARMVEQARRAPKVRSQELDVLLAAPKLEPEPGEPVVGVVGEKKMSDDREPPSAAKPSLRSGRSLKELAERVSKTPSPAAVRSSSPSVPPAPVIAVPVTQASPVSTPVPVATPEPIAAVAKVEAVPVVAAAPAPPKTKEKNPASKTPATLPTGAQPTAKKGGLAVILGGGAVVALAAAAAVVFYMHNKASENTPAKAPEAAAATSKPAPAKTAEETPAKDDDKPEVAKKDPDGVDLDKMADATASATAQVAAGGGPLHPAGSASAAAVATNDTKDGPKKVNPDGTLSDAMEKAAGGADKPSPDAQPASGDAQPRNLPDMPPTGSVTAAMGSVRGAARSCVAGADGDSTAVIIFNSSGAAQSVSVGGWAAGKPAAAACIQAAGMRAHVEPFTKPTFSAQMTIRP